MKVGVIAGNFDVIHPGYINMFKECDKHCDKLIVLLHRDPSVERPEKLKPILEVYERREMLLSLIYVDDVISYSTEEALCELIQGIDPDVRFLGDDYIGKSFTGEELGIPIHYLSRNHGWSTTKYKQLIADSLNGEN
jgi:glycerol-3-phosphate cytidylyltransferase